MRVVGVIPSRWGSTRFPGKSLAAICGKPLVAWVVEACLRSRELTEVLVATDDERIAQAAESAGAGVVMTRADHPSGTDRVAEAARAADGDIVINVQGDEPMMEPVLIDRIVTRMRDDPTVDMATACVPIASEAELESVSVVKLVMDAEDRALYFSRLPIPYVRDGGRDLESGLYWRHIGIYGYRGGFLERFVSAPPCAIELAESLEQLRALHLGGRIAVVRTGEAGLGVDHPDDVGTVERLMRERGLA